MNNYKKLKELIKSHKIQIGIIGLGYVGLPLAVEFGKKYNTVGFDLNKKEFFH